MNLKSFFSRCILWVQITEVSSGSGKRISNFDLCGHNEKNFAKHEPVKMLLGSKEQMVAVRMFPCVLKNCLRHLVFLLQQSCFCGFHMLC